MRKSFLLHELDDVMASLEEEAIFPDELMIEEEEGEYAIFVSELRVQIPALKLEFREGYSGLYQEDEDDYMPDFSITALYEEGADPENFLMWEQDSPLVTLANYTHQPIEDLEQLSCVLLYENP